MLKYVLIILSFLTCANFCSEVSLSTEDIHLYENHHIKLNNLYKIPNEHKKSITLFPQNHQISTAKNKIIFKGKNLYKSKIIIGNHVLPTNSNGNYYAELELDHNEEHIPITFFTLQNTFFTVFRSIKKLNLPDDLDKFKNNHKAFVSFYNSQYTKNKDFLLRDYPNRAQFAFFLCKLHKLNIETIETNSYQPFIDKVLEKKWMMPYADGKFHQDKSITQIDLLIAILKSEKKLIKIKKSQYWSEELIEVAKKEKLVNKNIKKKSGSLTWADLITHVQFLPQLKNLNNDLNPKKIKTSKLSENNKALIIKTLRKINQQEKEIYIENENLQVVYQKNLLLRGQIFPVEAVQINDIDCIVDEYGFFQQELILKEGLNKINIKSKQNTKEIKKYFISSSSDLENHWAKENIAKLTYAGIIQTSELFEPKKNISRYELAVLIKQLFQWNESTASISPVDFVTEKGIMNTNSNNLFEKEKLVTRAEALSALIRAANLSKQNQNDLPFWDIPKNHWAVNTLKIALEHQIISKNQNHFYPKRLINKAELMSLISKLPNIKQKIKDVFEDQEHDIKTTN